jgi:hypothetical protein
MSKQREDLNRVSDGLVEVDKERSQRRSEAIAEQQGEPLPPFGSKRKAAMAVYTPPFKYLHGYIYDSQNNMVADADGVDGAVAARVRGWGRLGYMPNGAELQDEIGQMMADALNALYTRPSPEAPAPQNDDELPGMWEHADFTGGAEESRGPDWEPPAPSQQPHRGRN